MNTTLAFAGAAAFALSAFAPAYAQKSPDALADAFVAAVVAEDAAALAALYTEDADSYGPGGDVTKGRADIEAGWADFFAGFDGFSASIEKAGGTALGKDAYAAWGLWEMSATPVDGDEPTVWKGRFMDVSVKTKDGWRYRADHASMRADGMAHEEPDMNDDMEE